MLFWEALDINVQERGEGMRADLAKPTYQRTRGKMLSRQIGEEGGSTLYSDQTRSTNQERQEGPEMEALQRKLCS